MRIHQCLAIRILLCASLLPLITSAASIKNAPLSTKHKQSLIHLLKQDCGSCHGMTLKGGLGPALLPENLKGKPTLLIKNTILFGRPGTAMPPWQGLLTEQEALWLTKQLQQGISHENTK
jgi:cytochrome c55X